MFLAQPCRAAATTFAVALGLLVGPTSARADHGAVPLGTLLGQSLSVIAGTVRSITPAATPGRFVIGGNVSETLAGVQTSSFAVTWPDEEEAASGGAAPVKVGDAVLVFVPPVAASAGPFGEQMLIPLTSLNREISLATVRAVDLKGVDLRMADVETALRQPAAAGGELPGALRAGLLAELSLRVSPSDATLLVDLACPNATATSKSVPAAGTLVPRPGGIPCPVCAAEARLFAIEQGGRLGLEPLLPCLSEAVGETGDLGLAIAAADALGDLLAAPSGSISQARPQTDICPNCVGALLARLPLTRPDPRPKAGDLKSDVRIGTTSANDPDDESNPVPDTTERQNGVTANDPETPAAGEPDPEDHADDGLSDGSRRRSDGGLALAVAHALGKIGDPTTVPALAALASEGDDLALHSTVVGALGRIGDARAIRALKVIAKKHPNPLIRAQASERLARL